LIVRSADKLALRTINRAPMDSRKFLHTFKEFFQWMNLA
jgi:hypothetical protein